MKTALSLLALVAPAFGRELIARGEGGGGGGGGGGWGGGGDSSTTEVIYTTSKLPGHRPYFFSLLHQRRHARYHAYFYMSEKHVLGVYI